MTKVYLMIEADVGELPPNSNLTPEGVALMNLHYAISAVGDLSGNGWAINLHGATVFQVPTSLPVDLMNDISRESLRRMSPHARLRQAVIEDEKKPPKERFQALVDRGAIDEEGRVLLKSPLTEGEQ